MPRPELGDITVGTPVMVEPANYGRRRGPDEPAIPAQITKVARVWLTIIRTDGRGWPAEWRMRRDTQDEGDRNYAQRNARFYTLEQHAYLQRLRDADQTIRDHGIRLDLNSRWSDEDARIRLADLLTAADTPEG